MTITKRKRDEVSSIVTRILLKYPKVLYKKSLDDVVTELRAKILSQPITWYSRVKMEKSMYSPDPPTAKDIRHQNRELISYDDVSRFIKGKVSSGDLHSVYSNQMTNTLYMQANDTDNNPPKHSYDTRDYLTQLFEKIPRIC